jgi:hypothetical protein
MHHNDLNRAVAHATGETVATIKRRGFQPVDLSEELVPELQEIGPQVFDWDTREAQPYEPYTWRPDCEPIIA